MPTYLLVVHTGKLGTAETPAAKSPVDQERRAIENVGGAVLEEFVCGLDAESEFIADFPRDQMFVEWRRAADARGLRADALRMYGGCA